MLSHDTTIAARVLAEHGVSLDAARREVVRIYGDAPQPAALAHAGLTSTPRANVVGVLAQIEAERLGASKADSGHYLLALLTEGDSAAAVLKSLSVDLRALRRDLLTALQVPRAIGDRYSRERDAYLAESACESEGAAKQQSQFPREVSVGITFGIGRGGCHPQSRKRQRHRDYPPSSDCRPNGKRDEQRQR